MRPMTDAETLKRIGRLERLVEHLYQQLDVAQPSDQFGVSPEVQQLAQGGNLIEAIKLHRRQSGRDLATAKAEVEAAVSPRL
jgi:ribosomal protein L7/L12